LDVLEELEEMGAGEVIMMDGFSDAIKGYSMGAEGRVRLIYGYDECIGVLERDMPREEALDYFEYNTIRSLPYQGEAGPIVMSYFMEEIPAFHQNRPEAPKPLTEVFADLDAHCDSYKSVKQDVLDSGPVNPGVPIDGGDDSDICMDEDEASEEAGEQAARRMERYD